MYYFSINGGIDQAATHGLIHFFNSKRIDENYEGTFTIFISSTGGDIDSAIRVYDFLKSITNKIHTIGFGQVDSSALLVYLAGDKRTALEDTRFRIHEATYHVDELNAPLVVFEERTQLFQKLDMRMKSIVAKELNKTLEKVEQEYANGKILSIDEAIKLGIVHHKVKGLPKPEDI